jgi:hypothetical protein
MDNRPGLHLECCEGFATASSGFPTSAGHAWNNGYVESFNNSTLRGGSRVFTIAGTCSSVSPPTTSRRDLLRSPQAVAQILRPARTRERF